MTDYVPPCAQPENDPNDWFIEKDGRQYADEPIMTSGEVQSIWDGVVDLEPEERLAALNRATAQRVRENQMKRRHAKDKCHVECLMRLNCLAGALDEGALPVSGIWGGYFTEELRAIRREQRARVRRHAVPTQE